MARGANKADDLAAVTARREALLAELAQVEDQVKAAEQAARDAGRPTLQAALDRVKIAAMDKSDARTIAVAIGQHGAKAVAAHLSTIQSS